MENEGAGTPDVWGICGVPGGCSRAHSGPGAHRVRSRQKEHSRALTVLAALPNRQHKERVYPHPLNKMGRDERTF